MGAISSWLLSIAGVVILSVLAELILPDGQINRYIKAIFSFVILLVIISPLPKLFKKDFNLDEYFNSTPSLQKDYIYQVNLDKISALTKDLSARIEEEGLCNVVVSIDANVLTQNLEIFKVFVDLCDIEYTQKFPNKDISKAKVVIRDIIDEFEILKDVEIKFNE